MHREPHTARNSGAAEAAGVLGATSFVGQLVLARLQPSRHQSSQLQASLLDESAATSAVSPVFAFSRQAAPTAATSAAAGIHWQQLPASPGAWHASIPHWIAVCPLWAVPEHFALLEAAGARRLVALSSTSRFTKRDSAAAADRAIAARLAAAEEEVLDWAQARGIAATILRPTLIYDGIHDRNVTLASLPWQALPRACGSPCMPMMSPRPAWRPSGATASAIPMRSQAARRSPTTRWSGESSPGLAGRPGWPGSLCRWSGPPCLWLTCCRDLRRWPRWQFA